MKIPLLPSQEKLNSKLEQNDQYCGDIVKCIFLKENLGILMFMLLKFVSEGPIDIMLTLIQTNDNPVR